MKWFRHFEAPSKQQEAIGAHCLSGRTVPAEPSLLLWSCAPEASALRAFGFGSGPGDVPASPGHPVVAIGLHDALPRNAGWFVPARASGLQFAPQVDRSPPFFGDAANELVDKAKLRPDQGERVFFHQEQR